MHYAIVVAVVRQYDVAAYVRRFLRHPKFDSFVHRAGKIIRIAPSGMAWWQLRRHEENSANW
jgi:hypothetical protein